MSAHKPNILLVTTDSQRTDTLSCMGHPHALSPNLDRLAREGVLFRNAHTSSPVCMPARCSLLTGLHTPVHGSVENGIRRRTHVHVFPDLLKEQGYTNIMVGKTHFGPIPASFDILHHTQGEKDADVDDCYARHLRRHGFGRTTMHPNPIPADLFLEAFLVDTTIREIGRVLDQGDGPFFAHCSMISPHAPLDPPAGWMDCYRDRPLPALNYREREERDLPEHVRMLLGLREPWDCMPRQSDGRVDREAIDRERRLYYGLAAYCDAQVGRLVRFLDMRGVRESTLVIFTSDHGQQYYDHGFNDKHNYYDASWRVPLIMSMPGTLPAGESREFALWNDIPVSILAAAGTSCIAMQGFDLFTPLARGLPSPRKVAVAALFQSCALATRRWKLEYYFETGAGRLFDRIRDPGEQCDLFQSDPHRPVRAALLEALLRWRAGLMDVHALRERTRDTGGPVARRAAGHARALSGVDGEQRLQQALQDLSSTAI